jgi:hypothetical protein
VNPVLPLRFMVIFEETETEILVTKIGPRGEVYG